MKAVIQRVTEARVVIGQETVGCISRGLVVLLAIEKGDREEEAQYLARKITQLRIFSDDQGNLNRSLLEVKGQLLVISQFTLAGSTKKGRRPGFDNAATGAEAKNLYLRFIELARETVASVETGRFGAMMQVHLVNDGPVTFLVERRPDHILRSV